MRTEERWRWRIQWQKKWSTTRLSCTEEAIRKEHPEAIRMLGTMTVHQVPETDGEKQQRVYDATMPAFLRNHSKG